MGYRRSRAGRAAHEEWLSFLHGNAAVLREAGLPDTITESISSWDEFLRRGDAEVDPEGERFSAEGLSESQYAALTQLVDSYFAAGYEYFEPAALREEERRVLTARHGPPGE